MQVTAYVGRHRGRRAVDDYLYTAGDLIFPLYDPRHAGVLRREWPRRALSRERLRRAAR